MSWGKHNVYAWISYLLAFSGVAGFYFDVRTGKVTKSRFLSYYCRTYILLTLVTVPVVITVYLLGNRSRLTHYKLMNLCILTYPVPLCLSLFSCIFCAHRWQQRIIKIIEKLLKIEKLRMQPYNWETTSQFLQLRRLYWIRLLLLVPRMVAFIIRFSSDKGFASNLGITLAMTLKRALYLLAFSLIWQICYNLMKLQLGLEHLLLNPMPRSRLVQKVHKLQQSYYQLIHMINEICIIFKYPLTFYILQLIYNYCLAGFSLVQILFGKTLTTFARNASWFTITLSCNDALEFYILACVAQKASRLNEGTMQILRYPYQIGDYLERRNDWFALHLSWQNMNLRILGGLNINNQLVFVILINIVLHILYMVQSDYSFLQI